MIGIYKITSPSNKVYIGQSWNIQNRINNYRTPSTTVNQKILHRSLKKYGYENHRFEIIKELNSDCSQQDLDRAEIFFIYKYKSLCFKIMNLTNGGKGGKGTIREKRISQSVLYNLYIVSNHTKKEISEIVNQKERLIKKYLKEYKIFKPHNLKIKRDDEHKNKTMTRAYQKDILKYKNEKMSYKQIMTLIPVTHAVIANTISKNKKIKL